MNVIDNAVKRKMTRQYPVMLQQTVRMDILQRYCS